MRNYTAVTKSDAHIITVPANNEEEAIKRIYEELNKNPSRRDYIPMWEIGGRRINATD